ncbi:Protein kinase family protein [Rhynchospora pubera]|uniref:non-specific serine/threonine protein kinase n=1 Tax=Rhynchospora pubera TaxID=906938 RepID=A0AAV8C1R0_9POAL|nr:Protein kinase family protein [Rhynchospora pubera]
MAPFSHVLAITLTVLCIPHLTLVILAHGKDNFTKECPPSRCSEEGPVVRYPFRLDSRPPHCGYDKFVLSCSGNNTVLRLPFSGEYNVTSIGYKFPRRITITRYSWSPCPWRNIGILNLTGSPFSDFSYMNVTWLDCPTVLTSISNDVAGPISCLSSQGRFTYVAITYTPIWNIPTNCTKTNTSHAYYGWGFQEFDARPQALLYWEDYDVINCSACEENGHHCEFNLETQKSICSVKDSHWGLIAGISSGVVSILLLLGFTFHIIHQSNKKRNIHRKVEHFLRRYRVMNPTRYTYDDLKKITNKFKKKLGYGRFGTVYKGELMSGIPVAVKILDSTSGDGESFVNEVATIGRIHHVNVVCILGFCSEGRTRALVYEFMENGSLDNYISRGNRNPKFSFAEMLTVVMGIAEGMEYLHQGCEQRILHFDIKPHNILLDHSFTPKISDFGLSKLCPSDQSYVTISAARGTMGYLAPEMYSRNFGMVSYKSDVYSFGMLILEMISGRKNIDPLRGGGQNEAYFPEWIYDQLAPGMKLCSSTGMENDEEIMQKLAIVSLWCIQWSPENRPSMTRVIQMLGEDLKNLQMPPKPFMSS